MIEAKTYEITYAIVISETDQITGAESVKVTATSESLAEALFIRFRAFMVPLDCYPIVLFIREIDNEESFKTR